MSSRLLPTKFNNIIAALSEIAETHHNFVLTGSCALYLQGLLDREPNDIDIAFEAHALDWEKLFMDKGFTVTSLYSGDYANGNLEVNGIQVQFIEKNYIHRLGTMGKPIDMEEPFSIIREKWNMSKWGLQRTKHRQDMVNICQKLQHLNANQIT